VMQGLKELNHVKKVFIVSVSNECKEVLFFLERDFNDEPSIITTNIQAQRHDFFEFSYSHEESQKSNYAEPLKYLYE
ncbi:hypothetical protein KK062_30680, partial [Fulvivirgaceae bacterium PWU5]|nr:hypothetical protein [Dawidia cretensis]